ncbi:MAG: hypothetical protein KDK36_18435, partial [Leptospiraceae bacterium]|nr:hypothetical protein [Leptospiraceae bacterium]
YCDRGDWKLFTVLNSTEIEGKINFPAEILYAEVSKGKGRFNSLIGKEIQIEEIESKKNELLVDYYLGYDYTDLHRKREIQKKRYITDPKEIKKILKGNSFEDKYYKNSKLDFYFGFSEKLPSYTTKYPEGVPINKLFYKINDFSYSQENIPPFVFIERIDGEYYSSGNLYTQAIFYTAIYPGAIAIDLATTPLFFVYCSPFVFSLLQLEWIVINLFLRYVRLDFSYKKIIYKNLILKCSLQT